jgi:phage terminase small subunit
MEAMPKPTKPEYGSTPHQGTAEAKAPPSTRKARKPGNRARRPGPRAKLGSKGQTPSRPRRMTIAQQTFAHEYALHGNASEAYRQAYPRSKLWKPENLHLQASKLLKRPQVATRIEVLEKRKKAVAEKRFDVTATRLLEEYACIALANPDDYWAWGMREINGRPTPVMLLKPSSQLTKAQKAAVAAVEMVTGRDGRTTVNIKLHDKVRALRDLGQHLGLFEKGTAPIENHVSVHIGAAASVAPVDYSNITDPNEAMRRFLQRREAINARYAPRRIDVPTPTPSAPLAAEPAPAEPVPPPGAPGALYRAPRLLDLQADTVTPSTPAEPSSGDGEDPPRVAWRRMA